jgi:hypothetical protein
VGETFTQHPASSRASLQPYESALLSIFVQTRCTRTRMVELLVEVTAKRLQRWGLSQGFLTLSLCSLHGAPQVPTRRCGRVTYGKDLSGGDSCRSDLASVSAWWPQLWCVLEFCPEVWTPAVPLDSWQEGRVQRALCV